MKHGKDFYSWLHQVSKENERLYEDTQIICRMIAQCAVRIDDLKSMGFSDVGLSEDEWFELRNYVQRIEKQWGLVSCRVYAATEKHKSRQHLKSFVDIAKISLGEREGVKQ